MAEGQQESQEGQESQQPQERQYTEQEQRAMAHGWTPKDQWDGPEDEWISAREFNTRGDLFGRIAKDKREISELKTAVKELVDHSRKTYDEGYKAAVAELRAQRKAAIEEGDAEKAFAIDDKIDEVKERHEQEKQQFEQRIAQSKQPENPVFDAWHADNSWYLQDAAATAYANEYVEDLARQATATGTQVDYPKLLQEVTRKVKQKFPEKFGRARAAATVSAVEGGSSRTDNTPRTETGSEKDMTDQERSIMNTILKSTGMSKKDYLAERQKFISRKGG